MPPYRVFALRRLLPFLKSSKPRSAIGQTGSVIIRMNKLGLDLFVFFFDIDERISDIIR